MVDFVWYNCKGKRGFRKYTYQELSDELQEYAASFPLMTTQELVDWAKKCHPNVSIHAYDSTLRKCMKQIGSTTNKDVCLVYYIKDHHLYPILNDHLKELATQANQGGVDNLWKYMTDMKWSNKSSNCIMYQDLLDNMDELIIGEIGDKLTLAEIEDYVIILPPETKIETVIEEHMTRSNYFVEYLHFDNNGRLDSFMDHKNNMYVLNNDCDTKKQTCEQLHKIYKSHDFIWCNQSYTSLASSLFKHMGGYLLESQYNAKTQEIIDDVYPRALQWCSTDPRPENLTSLDISKCYPSILIDNKHPIPLYTIHDNIRPFSERDLTHNYGEYYIDVFDRLGKGIKIEAGFYSRHLIRELIGKFKMLTNNVKWFIQSRKTLAPDTFKNVLLTIFKLFPESQAKLLANSYIGELCRKYSRKDHGFTCNSLGTAQCIWTSALAKNRDVTIDSYQNPNTKQEPFSIRERQIKRIISDNTSINRFVISEAILKCVNLLAKNCSHNSDGNIISAVFAINTDGIFMTNAKRLHKYQNKKDVEFDVSHVGQTFITDSLATCFEKHYRENIDIDN